MGGLLIGGIVVAAVLAVIAIGAVFAIGPLLDENEAWMRYGRILEQRAEESARQTGWKLTHLECRLERQKEITNEAFRREAMLRKRMAELEVPGALSDDERGYCDEDEPDYFDYLDEMEAERAANSN